MGKDPAFLFYPNDYIGGTMGMTFEEKGAYIELLMLQFNRGHMTKHMIGQTVGQLWVNIEDKFAEDVDGKFYNKRLEEEQNKRKNYTESRRNNVSGNNQFSKEGNLTPKKLGHMTSHMEDEDVNIIKDEDEITIEIYPTFKDFWDAYDKKIGSMDKMKKKFDKLSQKEKDKIMLYVPAYVKHTPDKKYRKNPETFLNNKSWNDEIITKKQNGVSDEFRQAIGMQDDSSGFRR